MTTPLTESQIIYFLLYRNYVPKTTTSLGQFASLIRAWAFFPKGHRSRAHTWVVGLIPGPSPGGGGPKAIHCLSVGCVSLSP